MSSCRGCSPVNITKNGGTFQANLTTLGAISAQRKQFPSVIGQKLLIVPSKKLRLPCYANTVAAKSACRRQPRSSCRPLTPKRHVALLDSAARSIVAGSVAATIHGVCGVPQLQSHTDLGRLWQTKTRPKLQALSRNIAACRIDVRLAWYVPAQPKGKQQQCWSHFFECTKVRIYFSSSASCVEKRRKNF